MDSHNSIKFSRKRKKKSSSYRYEAASYQYKSIVFLRPPFCSAVLVPRSAHTTGTPEYSYSYSVTSSQDHQVLPLLVLLLRVAAPYLALEPSRQRELCNAT
eukprot:scaffold162254_cov18-Prasinocladus_malaysianus.AAC.1